MLNYYLNPRKAEREFIRSFFSPAFTGSNFSTLRTDITENEDAYLLEIEVAGYDKNEVKLSLDDGYLKIEATKSTTNETSEKKYITKEIIYGSKSRSFYVGNVDRNLIKASFNNGILQISVPKEELPQEEVTNYISID